MHIFTGKGGTGKTTLAYSLTLALKAQGENAYYLAFDHDSETKVCRDLKIPFITQVQKDITLDYVSEKLGSRILANWILDTAFFRAIYQMLPGIVYLILLSDILKRLDEDKDLHIVLDLPSTGHALTLFEAPLNFKALFAKGPLFEDLKYMQSKLLNQQFAELYICTLASELSFNESQEINDALIELGLKNSHIVFNNSLGALDIDEKKLPPILKKKVKQERKIIEQGKELGLETVFPFSSQLKIKDRLKELSQHWEKR